MKTISMAWRALARDFRAGELRLLWMSVALGVAVLCAVTFLSSRLQATLLRDAAEWLGGDVVLSFEREPGPEVRQAVQAQGLQAALTVTMPTMARALPAHDPESGDSRLVSLKAVDDTYPLKGQLRVLDRLPDAITTAQLAGVPTAQGLPTREVPAPGTVWVEPGVLEALGLQVGDAVGLGARDLRITRVLMAEPDRGMGFMSLAPRVLMHVADLPSTQLIQPASRVTWRLAVAGPPAAVRQFLAWTEAQLTGETGRGVRVETLQSGRPEMRQTLDRASQFMHMVGLLSALLCAVAVAMAAHHFANRRLSDCAMLRVLGVPQSTLTGVFVWEFLAVGVLASGLGIALGWLTHHGFVQILERWMGTTLSPPDSAPVIQGFGAGLTLLMAFGLPPVLQLARVPALRVMRRDLGQVKAASLGVALLGLAGFAALMLRFSSDWVLGSLVVGGFMAAVLAFALLAGLALKLLRGIAQRTQLPFAVSMATRQLAARPGLTMLQVGALATGLLALLAMAMLRTDLIEGWRSATPPDAPNRFVINIQPDQAQAVQAYLREAGVNQWDWYPMLRGRLVSINGRTIQPEEFSDRRAQSRIEREQNLSYANAMPAHNTVVAGIWQANDQQGLSVEESMAKSLRLNLGDQLGFDMAGQTVTAKVTSIRRVDWASMHVNFFFMFPRASMPDELAVSYISAFRAPEVKGFDRGLIDRFPNLTNFDVGQTIDQVQSVVGQVIQVIEFLFGFTLLSGLLVLFATLSFNREARLRDYAVMRAMGSSQAQIQHIQQVELLGVGALSGFLAALAALALGGMLAVWVFQFVWKASPWWLPLGTGLGALLAHLAGRWTLRDVVRRPVMDTLRATAEA